MPNILPGLYAALQVFFSIFHLRLLDAVEMIAAVRTFVVPDRQISAGIHPHPAASALRAFDFEIAHDYLLAGLPPTVRLLWQLQVGQITQESIIH